MAFFTRIQNFLSKFATSGSTSPDELINEFETEKIIKEIAKENIPVCANFSEPKPPVNNLSEKKVEKLETKNPPSHEDVKKHSEEGKKAVVNKKPPIPKKVKEDAPPPPNSSAPKPPVTNSGANKNPKPREDVKKTPEGDIIYCDTYYLDKLSVI
jgi:hypothetical protein